VLATDRIYVQRDITLKGANKITAFSYLYDDIGKTALQNVKISGSSCLTKSSEITRFFTTIYLLYYINGYCLHLKTIFRPSHKNNVSDIRSL